MWNPPPAPHFPSPYARPTAPLAQACRIHLTQPDEVDIATFVYAPIGKGSVGTAIAQAVLLIHGNGEEHGIFGPIIDSLVEAGHVVVAHDARGQGKSSRGSARLTYELLAADALGVLDALGVEKAHVLGFSDGGIEALLLARDHSERILSVTALGANLTPEGVVFTPDWDIEGIIAANHAWASQWATVPGGIDTNLLTPTPAQAAATADLMQLMLDEPHIAASSLAAISCPTTILVGEFDLIADYETVTIAQAIPGARLHVVPGCGHSLPKQAPETVTRILRETIRLA